jgi:hypothetical protein
MKGTLTRCRWLPPPLSSPLWGLDGLRRRRTLCARGEQALEDNCPLICFSASGGARMQEALMSLMQMAKTSAALAKMQERGCRTSPC